MKADIYVELPSAADALPKLAVRRGNRLEEIPVAGFKANRQMKAVAFAPALSVARFNLAIAGKSESEARKAALYAIEDDLAQPVEDVLLTLTPRRSNYATRDVYVVDKALMDDWRSTLQSLGLGHAPIIPENSFEQTETVVVDFGDRLLLASADRVIAADSNLPQDALDALIDAAGLTGAKRIQSGSLAYLSELHARNAGIELAGSGRQSVNQSSSGLPFWRAAGAIGLVAFALWFASIWAETRSLEMAVVRNETAAHTLFRAQFPGAPVPADIHAETQRQYQQLLGSSQSGFRPLTAALYEAIAGNDTVRLTSLSYSGDEGALRAGLQFAVGADAATFRSSLEAAGWIVELPETPDTLTGTETRIILRGRQ